MNDQWNIEKSQTERSRTSLANLLHQLGAKTSKSAIKCPFHDDKQASAAIKQAESGKWYFYCYVCDIHDDYWALQGRIEGRSVTDILSEKAKDNTGGNARQMPQFRTFDDLIANWQRQNPSYIIEEKNPYTNPELGEPDFGVVRYRKSNEDKKQFLQAHKNGDGGWHMSAPKGLKPLFNRSRVAQSENILIVEGEKCVRAFTKLNIEGWAATTNPGGANGTGNTDWKPLKGKRCVIWHDNDEPGRKHFEAVKDILMELDCNVARVRVEELGLPEKGDIADYLVDMPEGIESQVVAVKLILQDVDQHTKALALEDRLNAIMSGQFRHISFANMPDLSDLSKALLPGTVTTICGEPGAAKSFFVLEQFWRWILEKGEKVALFMFEEDDAFHQTRMLAQITGRSELTDVDYCQSNPEFVMRLFEDHKAVIEMLSKSLTTVKSQQKTQAEIAQWIREQAEGDADIIIVDPITAATQSQKPWIDDQTYMFEVKGIMEQTGKRLLQTTHPRMGKAGTPSLSGMSGGAAYPRFSQSVLWLHNYDKPMDYVMPGQYGTEVRQHKQSIQIRKSRNGKGQGQTLAVNLNFRTLCFDELGIIVPE